MQEDNENNRIPNSESGYGSSGFGSSTPPIEERFVSEPVIQPPVQGPLDSPVVSDQNPQPQVTPVETKKSPFGWMKNKKVLIPVIAGVLVVIFAGSAWAFTSWYQSPNKVLADALINAVTDKSVIYTGTINIEGGGSKAKIDITSKHDGKAGSLQANLALELASKKFEISGDAIYDKNGDVYFKFSKLKDLMVEIKSNVGMYLTPSVSDAIDKFIKKIDGTWVRISSDDLKQFSSSYEKAKDCTNNAINQFFDDKAVQNEVTDLYRNNAFVLVDKNLGEKDGSYGYRLKVSEKPLKSFVKGLKNTKIYKAMHSCDSSFELDENDFTIDNGSTTSTSTFDLWAGVWNHKITKISTTSTSDGSTFSAVINPKYDQKFSIEAPKSYMSLSDLRNDITNLTNQITQSMYTYSADNI